MDSVARLRVNRPDVISDVIEGEAMLINASNGHYYILNPTGTLVWCWIEAEAKLEDIVARLIEIYPEHADKIAPAVQHLINDLQNENLVLVAPPLQDQEGEVTLVAEDSHPPFEMPMIETFTDLSELILMDPIHDVSERGWPQRQRVK